MRLWAVLRIQGCHQAIKNSYLSEVFGEENHSCLIFLAPPLSMFTHRNKQNEILLVWFKMGLFNTVFENNSVLLHKQIFKLMYPDASGHSPPVERMSFKTNESQCTWKEEQKAWNELVDSYWFPHLKQSSSIFSLVFPPVASSLAPIIDSLKC